jgi:hypothetical protein
VQEPTQAEIDETIRFIYGNFIHHATAAKDSVFALMIRDAQGKRIFGDDDIAMLGNRQRDVINRILDDYKPVAMKILAMIEKAGKKKE